MTDINTIRVIFFILTAACIIGLRLRKKPSYGILFLVCGFIAAFGVNELSLAAILLAILLFSAYVLAVGYTRQDFRRLQ